MPDADAPLPFEAYNGNEPYIFVSYSHKDGRAVFPDIKHLHDQGYRIWYDEGIDPGNEWPNEVAQALYRAAHFLVFITENACVSKNVRNEINFALSKNKRFLAVHLTETILPPALELQIGGIQAILKHRMVPDRYYRKLISALPADLREPIPETNRDEAPVGEKGSTVPSVVVPLASPVAAHSLPLTTKNVGTVTRVVGLQVIPKSEDTIRVDNAFMMYWPQNAEFQGIKVRQAGGETVALWKNIRRINITDATNVQDIKGEIILPNGNKRAVTVVPAALQGKTNLGNYKASIGDLRSITPIWEDHEGSIIDKNQQNTSPDRVAALQVLAKSGAVIRVDNAFMMYWPQNVEYQGIKVRQAGGETVALWKNIRRINITDATNPQDIKGEIILANENKTAVTIVPAAITGKTDLGEYKVSVADLRSITPVW